MCLPLAGTCGTAEIGRSWSLGDGEGRSEMRQLRQPQCCYVDFALGGTHCRNNVVQIHEIRGMLRDGKEAFRTWHRFPRAYLEHARQMASAREDGKPSVSGYRGTKYADYLPFDFDDRQDLGRALDVARKFAASLQANWEVAPDSLLYWFSGCKGFHIAVPGSLFGFFTPSPDLNQRLKALAGSLVGDLPYDGQIYDANRLLRMENTRHSESGLYKVRLTSAECLILGVDAIRNLAIAPRDVDVLADIDSLDPNPYLVDLWRRTGERVAKVREHRSDAGSDEVLRGGVEEGERDNSAFRIACDLRDRGLAQGEVLCI